MDPARPKRLAAQAGNHGSPSVPARNTTPRHKGSGSELIELIRTIEREWDLGLDTSDEPHTPKDLSKDTATQVGRRIQNLYWTGRELLLQTIDEFRSEAGSRRPEERLSLLEQLLCAHKSTRVTPSSNRKTAPRTLDTSVVVYPRLRSEHSNRLFKSPTRPSTLGPDITDPDPGSPTDEDENYVTPPSPTPSSRSAPRRMKTSSSIIGKFVSQKRPPESSSEGESPPKLAKTENRSQRLIDEASPTHSRRQVTQPRGFVRPSLEMARSYQAPPANDSLATSFNTIWSSQGPGTQPDTSATSFCSDGEEVFHEKVVTTRASSRTTGLLKDSDLLQLDTKLEKERHRRRDESGRETTPTYGSIDGGAMVDLTSRGHETRSLHCAHRDKPTPGDLPPESVGQKPTDSRDSPSKMPHDLRDIPQQNLFFEDTITDSTEFNHIPYFIRFICCRIAIECGMPLPELLRCVKESSWSSYEAFQESMKINAKCPINSLRESKDLWTAVDRKFDGFTFKGCVNFSTKRSGPVFRLQVLPIQADKSNRFQRAFGSDRFIFLRFPKFDSTIRYTKAQKDFMQQQWVQWLLTEHSFLGRKWRAYHIEPIKKGKEARGSQNVEYDKRVILFAIAGHGIDVPYPLGDFLNWHFPFKKNEAQSFCKAYARFDLGHSRTTPTLAFTHSQIRRVADIKADGTPEDDTFNDPKLSWPECSPEKIMNDGCARISVGAALEIWKIYKKASGTNDPLPSAFQGRIAGAKGLWMISDESYSKDPDHLDFWIEVSESQLKFEAHDEDYFEELCDRHRLTFELVKYSVRPVPSDLHISFIPILADRGVPSHAIADIMTERLDLERQHLLQILRDPVKMYEWIYKQGPRIQDEIQWQAALPHSLDEKIRLLLETGFSPVESPYLARCLQRYIEKEQLWREKKLRTPLGKSTYVFGVADPYGVLAPGEIHLQFSSPFEDEMTNETFRSLHNLEVLVARQPACRRSDIQKVRVTVHPRLAHLVDLIVFPSKGQYPLAGKLQGGDYDGDTFWTCWEPSLVTPFQNAPAPVQDPTASDYGIKQDKRKVRDVMNPVDLATVDQLIREAIVFRTSSSMLGMVTNYLEKQAYRENRVWSETLDRLCDVHDLLVDGPKQGYLFTHSDFRQYVKRTPHLGADPGQPAYKTAMEACELAKEMGEAQDARIRDYKTKKNNVLDFLYFEVVRAHHKETLSKVKEILATAKPNDKALQYPHDLILNEGNQVVKEEITALKIALGKIRGHWNSCMQSGIKSSGYNRGVEECYKQYRDLEPIRKDDPDVKAWLKPYFNPKFAIWDTIKASTLYSMFLRPEKAPFIFHMAGRELTKLKADSNDSTRFMVREIHANMKPRPTRVPTHDEDTTENDASDDDFLTSMEDPIDMVVGFGA